MKSIQTVSDLAFIGDMMQSIQITRYDASTHRLALIGRDANLAGFLDCTTVAVGDKFGNVSILRLPRGADAGAIDLTGQ